METVSPNTNDDFYSYYTSAPSSPRNYNNRLNDFFLSMPTSPTRNHLGFKSGSITPVIPEDFCPFYAENFEFEGSKRFFPYENGFEKSHDFSLAYADDLFSDGKMVPLRLPPRAQNTRSVNDSTASSPGGRGSKLKVLLLGQRSLWNDGYDPFLAALNKVKQEGDVMGSNNGNKAQLRRSKSLSPFRRPNGPERWTNKVGFSQDKDVLGPYKSNVFGPIIEPNEDIRKSESSESRRQRIKKYLLKNASFLKEVNGKKREQKTPLMLRKIHTSQRFSSTSNSNAIIRISRGMKSLMKHRARIFYCLAKGFGIKSTTK